MSGIGRHGAGQVVERMIERWPSAKWDEGSLAGDWLAWIEPMEITVEQAELCLRECKGDGLTAYFDSHIPRIRDKLRSCQPRRDRVDRNTGEVVTECPTCCGGRQVRFGEGLPFKYGPCPSCHGSGVAA